MRTFLMSIWVLIAVLLLGFIFTSSISFADYSNQEIALLSQGDGTVTPLEPRTTMEPKLQGDLKIISGNVQRPNGIFWYDNYLYTGCAGDFTIYKIHDTTGVTSTYIAGIQNVHTLLVEDGPVLWVADFQRNALVQVDTSQSPSSVEITASLASPWGVVKLEDESFFVSQLRSDDIVHVTREGVINVIVADFRNPTGIVADDNLIYVANNGSARRAIEWFEIDPSNPNATIASENIQPLVSGLQNTTNLLIGPDDLLYFAYSLGTRGIVGRVDPAYCRDKGGCTNVDVEIVLWSELVAPLAGLAISDDMRMFVHTMFGAEIYWVQLPNTLN